MLAHVLAETACHAGHLDAARELLDGRTWDYETDQLTDGSRPATARAADAVGS